MELPRFLIDQVRKGQVVLFLGAGASFGSKNAMGENPPLGSSLAQQLSQEAGIKFIAEEDDLAVVAANAKKRLGDDAYFRFLRERYLKCSPSAALSHLSQFPWYRIYSLNIDDALEAAYRKSEYSLDTFVHSSPLIDRAIDGSQIQLIKLNGSIDRLESGLIFTPEEYRSQAGNYGKWYEQVAGDFLKYTFLFVGTQLNEPIFRHNVDRLVRLKGQRPGTSYIVAPNFSENKKIQFESENIIAIEGGVDDLARALVASLGIKVTVSQMVKSQHPNLQQLIARVPESEIGLIAGQLDALELVIPDMLRERVPAAKPGVRNYYYGSEPTWRDVLDGVPAEIKGIGDLVVAVNTKAPVTLLHGPAGSGKSTAMMMAAYATAKDSPSSFVVWIHGSSDFPRQAIERLAASRVDDVVIFVDDFSVHAADLIKIVDKKFKNVRLVISERSNLIPSVHGDYHVRPDKSVSLKDISISDIDLLLNKLEQFGPWDRLGRMPISRRRQELENIGAKQLLVGLREATQGIGFDKIAASEYERIQGDYARKAYLVVALASMHRLEMSISTFDAAVRKLILPSTNIPGERLAGLEDIVFQNGGWLRTRHQILSEFTMSQVVDRKLVLSAVDSVFHALSRYESPIRKSTNKGETRLFAALTNHDFMWRLFRQQREEVIELLAKWEMSFSNDGLYWLHYALFEEKCGAEYLESAVNHIRTALRIFPESFQIVNAYANIHFALALNAKSAQEALLLMEQASLSISDQVAHRVTESYTAVALSKGRISVLSKWYPDRVPAELKLAEQRLRDAFKNDPGNRRIQQTINELHLGAAGLSNKYPIEIQDA